MKTVRPYRHWTMAEINYLREFYPVMSTNHLAEKLGTTYFRIKEIAYRYKIKKLKKVA